jgi:acetate kinase
MKGLQRYGFHGLSYEYIASVLPHIAPEIAKKRVLVAHLGSGASLCALKEGKSIDSTLGFTALDGLCMGTQARRFGSRSCPSSLSRVELVG